LPQVPRALDGARRRERGEGRGESGARRRAARDRGRDSGGAVTAGWSAVLARWPRRRVRWSLPARRATRRPAPATVVYRWDLDKTYLKSDFESLRKMMRVPFERAGDKVDEPGVVA